MGTLGNIGVRLAEVTASARTLPPLICGSADTSESNIRWVCPLMRSGIASAVPLYGTCVSRVPEVSLNNSLCKCTMVPLPLDAKLSESGFALAKVMSSLTSLAGKFGVTINTLVAVATSEMGAKSFSAE